MVDWGRATSLCFGYFLGERRAQCCIWCPLCPVWVTAQQRQWAWRALCVKERLPKLKTGTSFWQTPFKEPFQLKYLYHGTKNKLSLTQRRLITRLSRNCDCRNKLGKGVAPAGCKSASQQPSCQVCHLRVQPCMVWSARGTASPNSSSAKSYPGSKRPEFSFSLYKKVQSVQKRSLGAESLIFIHLFHLLLGESFSNTLRCQT